MEGFVSPCFGVSRRSASSGRVCSVKMSSGGRGELDDAKLNDELKRRVRELFGDGKEARPGVGGQYSFDSGSMRKAQGGEGAVGDRRDAVFTLSSIAVMSVIAGIVFTFLWNSGFVHDGAIQRRYYDMPTYGSASYIEPFELLAKDYFQESKPVDAQQVDVQGVDQSPQQ